MFPSELLEDGTRSRRAAGQRPAQLAEVLGGVDVEQQPGERLDVPGGVGRARPLAMALEAPRAEGGLDRVGWREQQRVGATAVAVGDDRHRRWRGRALE